MRTLLTPLTPLAFATFAALGILGCLPTDQSGSSSGSAGAGGATDSGTDGGVSQAGKACLDTADAFAAAAMRCGGDAVAEKKAFIDNLANGDCNSVTIRNEAELRRGCIPSFSRISCPDLVNQRFDPTCAEQLVRSK